MRQLWGTAVAIGAVLRGLLQPLPRPTSTEQRLAMLPDTLPAAAPVTIHWDEHQIPFIEAQSDADLAVGLGVVHAHLRLAQIELMRRIALGRVAEIIGPRGIEIDRAIRLFDFGRAVPAIIAALPEATRRWAEGFVAGFNHTVAHLARSDSLPHEFALLRLEPEPWTLTDLFVLGRLISTDVNWMISARLLRARAAMSGEEWARLWPVLLESGAAADSWTEAPPLASDAALAEQALARSARTDSNSAAVAAGRSAGGAAMIASDPHLPITLPNLWLIAGMHSPGVHAVGLMLPGMPFVGLGRNPWIAWGGTSLHAASSELFDVSGETLTERYETIRVRGARPQRIRLRASSLGPVVSDGVLLRNASPIALRWVGHQPTDEFSALLALAQARNWQEFRDALAGFAVPGQNMLYADTDGRVGHVLAAHVPRRRTGKPPDLVADPARAPEWTEFATGRELPAVIDPAEGFVASANNRPPASAIPVGFFFSPPDRISRLRALLGGAPKVTAADLQNLQQDVLQPGALGLRDLFLARLGSGDRPPAQRRVLEVLAGWDGSYAIDSRGAAAFELLLAHVAARLWPENRIGPYRAVWTTRQLMRNEIATLPEPKLRSVLDSALAATAPRFARLRDWGAMHRLRLRHLFAEVPLLGRRYVFAEFPVPGGNDTLHKTGHGMTRGRHFVGYGACARHISDLADPDDNRFVLLGGQDGWFGSANFLDQAELWRRGEYVTVPLRLETVRARFPHKTVLRPAGAAVEPGR